MQGFAVFHYKRAFARPNGAEGAVSTTTFHQVYPSGRRFLLGPEIGAFPPQEPSCPDDERGQSQAGAWMRKVHHTGFAPGLDQRRAIIGKLQAADQIAVPRPRAKAVGRHEMVIAVDTVVSRDFLSTHVSPSRHHGDARAVAAPLEEARKRI